MRAITPSRGVGWLVCALSAYALSAAAYGQAPPNSKFLALQPEDVRPADGATQKVIMGDPSKPGLYVVQNTFAPGRGSRPHYHDQDRYVTVIKGTWWVALGPESDVYDPSKMVAMKAGSLTGTERLKARMRLEVDGVNLELVIEDDIALS